MAFANRDALIKEPAIVPPSRTAPSMIPIFP
ncbi:hypothetical protein FHT91_006171 [Rhizobium sp. BK347]|nr:hypothetical protein [Rhizobium sp. BK252]MBB3405886.1 hypothetical protein [Rhizobium sp. BK289]MBB3418474.1 hypothetical protein [Rhizobium sp. BK284]MBB3486352.1 hypothetical protein [Rhizobium sp. BK347]